MKYISSQIALFLEERGVRRNLGSFTRFIVAMLALIFLYTVLFHVIMLYEGREYSHITGVYWTLTVMSTLGFGDITFHSDLGRLFSVVVLMSGIICLLVMLPFAFIQLIYTPWMEAQKKSQTPRSVPESVSGHIIFVGLSPITLNIMDDMARYGYYAVLLVPDPHTALDLTDRGYHAVMGVYDDALVYRNLRLDKAALLVVLESDVKNTNIIFSAREVSPDVPIIARAEKEEAIDILMLAGCSRVYQFRKLLGRALGHRVLNNQTRASMLSRFGPLIVTEAPVMRTTLVGKTILESDLRRKIGINVVGIWEKGVFRLPRPDTVLTEKTVLVLAGTEKQIEKFDKQMGAATTTTSSTGPVIVLGGGRVGAAAAKSLKDRGINVAVVDKVHPGGTFDGVKWVHGDASDLAVLQDAGIDNAPSVIITTHDDDTNIYLTIYCRRLRPEMQIISRATLDRNTSILHSAGADLVLSLASMVTNSLINTLMPGKVFLLNEGLNIFQAVVGDNLAEKNLITSGIRSKTHCSVVAVCDNGGKMSINPEPDYLFNKGDILYLIGDSEAEESFYTHFGIETQASTRALKPALQAFAQAAAELDPEEPLHKEDA